MAENIYGAWAQSYWDAGWRGVLRIPGHAKEPPPAGYTGATGVDPSYADLLTWTETPGASNIALRLPEWLAGFDVDHYPDGSKRGAETVRYWERSLGPLPHGPGSSARDAPSMIRIFRVEPRPYWRDVGNDVETIHHGHRYIIAPGSINPKTGTRYRWIHSDSGEPLSGIPRLDDIPWMPAQWLERFSSERKPAEKDQLTDSQARGWLGAPASERPCEWMATAVAEGLHVIEQESVRHTAALIVTRKVARMAARGHRGAVPAFAELRSAWLSRVQADPSRKGDAEQEWRRAATGAVELMSANAERPSAVCGCPGPVTILRPETASEPPAAPAAEPPPQEPPDGPSEPASDPDSRQEPGQTGGLPTGPLPELETEILRQRTKREAARVIAREERPPVERPPFLTLDQRLAIEHEEPRWLIDGWQTEGSRVLLAAQAKSGKTTLIGNVIRALADGGLFLDRYRARKMEGTIALLDTEMPHRQLDQWLAAQNIIHASSVIPLPLRGAASSFDLLDDETLQEWAEELRQRNVQYLILDVLRPVLDAIGLNEHSEAGAFLVRFDELLKRAGIEGACIVHHMGHSHERSRGDSRLRDWPDAEWKLVRESADDPGSARFISAYGRDVEQWEQRLAFDDSTRRLRIDGGSRTDQAQESALAAIVELLRTEPDQSGRAIEAALIDDHAREAIREARAAGHAAGTLRWEKGAYGAKLWRLSGRAEDAEPAEPEPPPEQATLGVGGAEPEGSSRGSRKGGAAA